VPQLAERDAYPQRRDAGSRHRLRASARGEKESDEYNAQPATKQTNDNETPFAASQRRGVENSLSSAHISNICASTKSGNVRPQRISRISSKRVARDTLTCRFGTCRRLACRERPGQATRLQRFSYGGA
jgi:hypothetical protein